MTLKMTGCCLACWLAGSIPAAAQSVVLLPTKTNTLIQVTSPTVQQLSNGLGDIYVGRTNQDGQTPATISIRRGLIAFDIADSVPAGDTITGVNLAVDNVRAGNNGNQNVTLSQMYRGWGEGTSYFSGGQGAPATNGDATWYYTFYNASNPSASPTWTAPGGQAGVDYSASVSATSLISLGAVNETLSWSSMSNPLMLADVQQWLDSPATNFGWIMLGNESAGQTAKRFGGKDAPSPEIPPNLTVQYAPTWNWTGSAGNAAWSASGNWTAGAGVPASGAALVLGGSNATSGTVDLLSTAPSVSHLAFDANRITTITSSAPGGGRLTLDNGVFTVVMTVSGSGQAIDNKVALALNSDAWITTSGSGDSLSIAGDISDGTAAHGIAMDGPGTLILSGSDSYTGGTTVDAGTLIAASAAALPDGTSLTVGADAASLFTSSTASSSLAGGEPLDASTAPAFTSVPEPCTLVLLAAGAWLAVVFKATRIVAATKVWTNGS